MRVVIDSNVWLSALVFGGNPRRIFEKCINEGHIIVVSEGLLTEIRRILASKFPDFADDFEALLVALRPRLLYIQLGAISVDVSRDPDDNMVIETALIGFAKYIISGDKDLLVLKSYKKVDIVDPGLWLEREG